MNFIYQQTGKRSSTWAVLIISYNSNIEMDTELYAYYDKDLLTQYEQDVYYTNSTQ